MRAKAGSMVNGAGATILVLGIGAGIVANSLAQPGTKQAMQAMSTKDCQRLIESDAAAIQALLSSSTVTRAGMDKRTSRKAVIASYLVAVYAQVGGSEPTRDTALAVMKAVQRGDAAEARVLAGVLGSVAGEPYDGVTRKPVALNRVIDLNTLMRAFMGKLSGGFGLEEELRGAGVNARTVELGHKMAMIGEATRAFAPTQNAGGGKTRNNWLALSDQFRDASLGLAAAARAGNEAGVGAARQRVVTSCKACHDVFRDR